jgi:DNA invertase Pin-like site-specific DNA recombinase
LAGSGSGGKTHLRAGYRDLIEAVEHGGATVVYTKTLTRIGRSVPELYRFLETASKHGTRLVTMKEGEIDPNSPMGKVQFGMMAVFAEFERDLSVERALDNAAVRRDRGERMGRLPYGEVETDDLGAVLAAFREAGTFNAAATILNTAQLPTRLGRKWTATVRTETRRTRARASRTSTTMFTVS